MAKTVVALYDELELAERAVNDLVESGYNRESISLLFQDVEGNFVQGEGDEVTVMDDTLEGIAGGGVLGGLAGLVAGLLAMVVPGVGPVLAAGPVAAGLTGAGVGAVAGGLLGALVDTGIEREAATYYAEGIRRGNVLVGVETSARDAEQAESILARHSPVDLEERAAVWRDEGWKGYGAT
ncbi:MAG TPA: hypothetical protein VK879_14765 [Candidatus Sulfomarinibacteraceae bacterium]|nr:hypothetical protein [Candidatus Sulfomarinibacteraceae bacterium]